MTVTELDSIENVVLTDEELAEIEKETWLGLKKDPDYAFRLFLGAGWLGYGAASEE